MHHTDIMSGMKRKLESGDELPLKKSKCDTKDCHGRSWKLKLLSIVRGQYDIELSYAMAGLIFILSSGRWITCCLCNTETDDLSGSTMKRIDTGEIGFHCQECDPWIVTASDEFPFTDTEDNDKNQQD